MHRDNQADASMNSADLYLEEVFTDHRVGSIRRLTPVDKQGRPDPKRAVAFVGQAQIMTPAGVMPLQFEIEAKTLEAAVAGFAAGAAQAVEETMQELKALQREAASSIVVPGQGGMGLPGGAGLGGGLPGAGGKIQLR